MESNSTSTAVCRPPRLRSPTLDPGATAADPRAAKLSWRGTATSSAARVPSGSAPSAGAVWLFVVPTDRGR